MSAPPIVSVIIIFLNAADFLREAIESVLVQTYEHWELLLIDDGSSDTSTQIARHYAKQHPEKMNYLEHHGHINWGKGVSRNLGIFQAQGEYVAFLDADDVWLPNKLEEQVAILDSYPEAGMLYGDTLYWHGWTGIPEDISKDFIPSLGVSTDIPIPPPSFLSLYLRGRAAVPCTCSVLVRRKVAELVEGFDESNAEIKNFYEDQAFYAKICLNSPVIAVHRCWDKYRQRSSARQEEIANIVNEEQKARKNFLNWLEEYMARYGIQDNGIRQAIQKELWLIQKISWLPETEKIRFQTRWLKKWLLRAEECILPAGIQNWLWLRK
jgi:glycosyltransferase involved in cell wall biosynthesis